MCAALALAPIFRWTHIAVSWSSLETSALSKFAGISSSQSSCNQLRFNALRASTTLLCLSESTVLKLKSGSGRSGSAEESLSISRIRKVSWRSRDSTWSLGRGYTIAPAHSTHLSPQDTLSPGQVRAHIDLSKAAWPPRPRPDCLGFTPFRIRLLYP